MTHSSFTHSFRDGLFNRSLPPGLTAGVPDEVETRFAVHRNNVIHGLTRALARRFPVIQRLVGPEFFAASAPLFLAAHPPRDPRLFLWGDTFPAFLQSFRPLRDLPYLPDVARLEWLRGQAYHAADKPPAPSRALLEAAADPARYRLVLHPSVHLLSSSFAIASIWQANQKGAAPGQAPLRADRGETALILRDRADHVTVSVLSAAEAAFLASCLRGETLLDAALAAEGADPGPLLGRLAAAGSINAIIERALK